MKICHLNHSDVSGGAARAAYRIHQSLRRADIESIMKVNIALSDDWSVKGPASKWGTAVNKARAVAGWLAARALKTENAILHSPAILPSAWPRRLNASDADLVHLHWINWETLSIANISKIRKPIVWTLHDMWAFCGAEHYTVDFRWRDGYRRSNRPAYERGTDLNRWTWSRKMRYWKQPIHIVTPSTWLGDCVRNSALMRDWPVSVVPYAIDTDAWQPIDQGVARRLLQLPLDVPLVLFGAKGGTSDPRKGFDLLLSALKGMSRQLQDIQLVILGQRAPKVLPDVAVRLHYLGHLHDDVSLRIAYNAVDVVVIPSRQDNLPNAGIECHACGTPVVAFDVGGMSDIVNHKRTGYLAAPFDTMDLAHGVQWVLETSDRHTKLCHEARVRAVLNWSYSVVSKRYVAIYQEVIEAS